MSSKSLKRTAEIVVLCVCAAVVWGCESDAQKYAGELKIRHAICMNKAGTFNARASVQCLCENTPDLRLSSAYVCSEGVRVSCDSAPQFCESNGAGEIGRLTYCSAGVWKTGYCECNANQNGCRECDETKDLPVCYSDNGQIVSRYCDNGEFKFDVCTKGCNVNGECNQECDPVNAVTFCYDSDSTHEVRKCVNGVYKTMKTCDLGCANGKCNAECNTGEEKCENFTHYTCNDGMWEREADCPLGCDGKTCRNAACTDNVLCIMPENTVGYLFKCEEGKITENRTEVCKNDASCSSSNTCGECKNGEKKCVNGYTSVCVHGQLIPNKDEICDGRVCDDGVLYCRDNVLKECVDGKWKNTDCSLDGAFCDATSKQCKKIECNLGDVKCVGEKSINECGDDGQWNTTSCNNDGVCVHTDNGDKCTECIPKTALCEGNTIKLCDDNGRYNNDIMCSGEKPFCVNKTCVECKGNEKQCEGNILKQCENGAWKKETCTNGCVNSQCATQCEEYCDNNTPYVCSKNQGHKVTACDEGWTCKEITNQDGKRVARCFEKCDTNGITACDGDGKYKICDNGVWKESLNCTSGDNIEACVHTDNCKPCSEGTAPECRESIPFVCDNSYWQKCDTSNYTGDCSSICPHETCTGNFSSCSNGVWSICIDGELQKGNCPYNAKCKNYTKCADCGVGATKCEDDIPMICDAKNGKWMNCNAQLEECVDAPNCCNATKLKISPDGFKYNIASDGFEDNYAPISDWSLECDNTKGLLIKDLGVCTGEILLSPGGNCFGLPYTATLSDSIMMDVRYIMLCNELQFNPFGLSNYVLTFSRAASGNSIKVETCDGDCNGGVCSNSCVDPSIIISDGQIKISCDESMVDKIYRLFTFECTDAGVTLLGMSGIHNDHSYSEIVKLSPTAGSTVSCPLGIGQEFVYSNVSDSNVSGSGIICAINPSNASELTTTDLGMAFSFDGNGNIKISDYCNTRCDNNSTCNTYSECYGGMCKEFKCICPTSDPIIGLSNCSNNSNGEHDNETCYNTYQQCKGKCQKTTCSCNSDV